jgi:hypothetical protein
MVKQKYNGHASSELKEKMQEVSERIRMMDAAKQARIEEMRKEWTVELWQQMQERKAIDYWKQRCLLAERLLRAGVGSVGNDQVIKAWKSFAEAGEQFTD